MSQAKKRVAVLAARVEPMRDMKRIALFLAICGLASPSLAVPVYGTGGSVQDVSGTVTAGGTSQQVAPAFSGRIYAFCQNPITATETLFVNFNASASTAGGSYELVPGGSVSFADAFIPNGAINVTAATTGHSFVCKVG